MTTGYTISTARENDYSQFRTAAKVFLAITFLIGALALVGWVFDIPLLKSFVHGWIPMPAITALGFILAAISLLLQTDPNRKHFFYHLAQAIGYILFALGAFTFLEYFSDLHFIFLNRMALPTAINFVLIGFSIIVFDVEYKNNFRPSQILSLLAALLPAQALIAYSYGFENLEGKGVYFFAIQMGRPSALAWLCLALGSLVARPDKGILRPFTFDRDLSATWRYTLFMALTIPSVFGFLFSFGYRKGFYDPVFGFSLFAMTCIFLMTSIVWRSATHTWRVRLGQLQAEDSIKQALKLRDEFLSIASHELKTPLTSLSLQAQISKFNLLKENPQLMSKEQLLEFLNAMDKQVLRLAQLVEDMVDISRIDCGRFSPVFKKTDLTKMLHDVTEQLAPQAKAAGCEVIVNISENLIGLWDTYRIEQILINLLTNAFKYGSKKPVHIHVLKKNDRAVISVMDFGIGIAKENQERIFYRFERAVSAKGITGLGLGLYIVKKILDSHNGAISVESQLASGSKFTIELPLLPETALSQSSIKDGNYERSS